MSLILAAALLVQLAALAVVLVPLRQRAIGLIGPAFVAIAVLYHGITELVQLVSPFGNVYDTYASQPLVDEWVWMVAVAILLVAVSYIIVLGRIEDTAREGNVAQGTLLSWKILLIVTAPLYVVLVTGQGSYEENYWLGGLSSQFFTLALALASFDFIRRHGGRYTVPVLLGQSAALMPVGERLTVVVGALLVVYALAWAGISPTRRQALLVLSATVLAALIISSAREAGDRFGPAATAEGSGPRVAALLQGAQRLPESWNSEGLWSDWVYRFDGNTYPAMIARELHAGREPVGAGRMAETALSAVPRFAYSDKAALDVTARNEETFTSTRYGFSTDIWAVDFLPTTLGMLYAYLGPFGLWGGAVFVGAAFALLDRWVRARRTTARLLTALGVLMCVLTYEQGIEVYPLTLRGVLVLVLLATALRWGGLVLRRHSTSPPRRSLATREPVGKAVSVPAQPT